MRFGIEKKISILELNNNSAYYILDSNHVIERLSQAKLFKRSGWVVKPEYTNAIVEFVSPIYQHTMVDILENDLIELYEEIDQLNTNSPYVLSDAYSNVTPYFKKNRTISNNYSDIYLESAFILQGDGLYLPHAYKNIDIEKISCIYDGMISTDVSFGRKLTNHECDIIGKKILEISIEYSRQKKYIDGFFFDGYNINPLDESARDYFFGWVNPQRKTISKACAIKAAEELCYTDNYTCRIKELTDESIIECKNLHSNYGTNDICKVVTRMIMELSSVI